MAKEKDMIETTDDTPEDMVKYEIPDDGSDFIYQRVILNGVPYEVKKGETVEVPIGVKEILETRKRNKAKIINALRERKNGAKNL